MDYHFDDFNARKEQVTMRVANLTIVQSGTYRDQWKRPYEMGDVNAGVIGSLSERIHRGGPITATHLAGLTDRLLAPSRDVEGRVFIPDGMSTTRTHFNMTIEIRTGMRINYEIVTGYSDHFGLVDRGFGNVLVDEHMKFYIDGIVNANGSKRTVGGQTIDVIQPSMIAQLLPDKRFSEFNGGERNFRMRPIEVVSGMRNSSLPAVGGGYVMDLSSINNLAAKSHRMYNSASHYAATLLDGYRQGLSTTSNENYVEENGDLPHGFVNSTQADVLENTIAALRSPNTSDDVFLNVLANLTGETAPQSFTINDLRRIDGNLDSVTHIHTFDAAGMRKATNYTNGADWNSTDGETMAAASLVNAVPAIMMQLGIVNIAFGANNMIAAMGHQVMLQNIDCLNQFINTDYLRQQFVDEMCRTVLQDLSFNNQIEYNLHMQIDLNREARLTISIGGQEPADYFMPCWCSSLMSPVVTNDNRRLHSLSKNFSRLLDSIGLNPVTNDMEQQAARDPFALNGPANYGGNAGGVGGWGTAGVAGGPGFSLIGKDIII